MNTINVENCKTLLIGRRGENEVTTVAFDFTEWQTEFGSGVVDLYVKRFGDDSAYPVVLTIDGTIATWTVTATDTNVAGYGKAEYVYRVDGKIAKSAVFPFFVAEDIGQPASEPPDPYESWLEQLTALGAETEAHAQAAEQSAEDAAESAASAEGYAGQAETAAGLSQAAQTASEAARDAAQTAQASAESSATAASGSAASAAGSATAAAGSASDASSSASAAGASATTASTAATQAEAAKTAAQTAQSAAEDAAEDAQEAAQQAHVEYEQLSGEVDDLSDEVALQKSAIEDLQALTNRKAGALIDTASGAIASFVPDSTIPDLLGVSVDIEPVQDLHGYDAPWPAGGSVQLLNIPDMPETTRNGVTYHIENGVIYANGTCTDGFTPFTYMRVDFDSDTYTFSVQLLSGSTSGVNNSFNGFDSSNAREWLVAFGAGTYPSEMTKTADIRVIGVAFNNGAVFNNAALAFQVEIGSEMSTFRPYSNECPIYGWDSVEVDAAGENLVDEAAIFGTLPGWTVSDGVYTGESRYIHYAYGNGIPGLKFKPLTQYAISVHYSGATSGTGLVLAIKHTDGTYIRTYCQSTTPTDYQLTSSVGKTVEKLELSYGNNVVVSLSNFQIAEGSTAPEYKPYAGTTYTIQLGQTVYGGTLDVTAGTLTVDRARVVYDGSDDETWERHSSGSASAFAMKISLVHAFVSSNVNIISNYLTAISSSATWGNYDNWVSSSSGGVLNTGIKSITDVTTWRTYLANNPLEVRYELATPITITLDPVTISTISGQTNNVWADAGDVSVEFAADLKHYIDSKIAAAVAAMS